MGTFASVSLDVRCEASTFADKMHGVNGRKNALTALKQVVDGSASPRETAVCMCLCLPYRLGGYGFEKPKLNHRIDIRRTQKLCAKPLVGAVCWPTASFGSTKARYM